MRAILTSAFLLFLILTFCLFSAFHVSGIVSETENLLQQAMERQQQEDPLQTARLIQLASEIWEKNEPYFGMVLCHDEIDAILDEFARLEAYADSHDQDDFRSTCAALLASLKHIREMEWPFAFNIL